MERDELREMKLTYLAPESLGKITGWAYLIDLETVIRDSFLITQLYVPPAHRGKGMAKAMLTKITEDADSEGTILLLDFRPEEFNSDPAKLRSLYASFGFEWDREIRGMRRNPTC